VPKRDTLLKALGSPRELPVASPVLGFVGGFTPTYIATKEARRQEKLAREESSAERLAKILQEREKRRTVLDVDMATAMNTIMKSMGKKPAFRPGPYPRGVPLEIIRQAGRSRVAEMQARARRDIATISARAKDVGSFVKEMERLHKMTLAEAKLLPSFTVEYTNKLAEAESYRLSGIAGKRIKPEEFIRIKADPFTLWEKLGLAHPGYRIAPKAVGAEGRFNELIGQGYSEEEAYRKLTEEGY